PRHSARRWSKRPPARAAAATTTSGRESSTSTSSADVPSAPAPRGAAAARPGVPVGARRGCWHNRRTLGPLGRDEPAHLHALTRIAVVFCLLAVPAAAQPPEGARAGSGPAPAAEVEHVTAPVVLDGETLIQVRGTYSYPAEERARRITERIEEVARTKTIAPEAVRAEPAGGGANVGAGDRLLLLVTDADGRLEGIDRLLLARTHADRIQRALRSYRQAREPAGLLRGARRAGLAD